MARTFTRRCGTATRTASAQLWAVVVECGNGEVHYFERSACHPDAVLAYVLREFPGCDYVMALA